METPAFSKYCFYFAEICHESITAGDEVINKSCQAKMLKGTNCLLFMTEKWKFFSISIVDGLEGNSQREETQIIRIKDSLN